MRMKIHPTVPSSSGDLITPLPFPISRESSRGSHRFPSRGQEGPPTWWETPLSAQAEPPRQVCRWVTRSHRLAHSSASLQGTRGRAPFPVTPGSLPAAGSLKPHGGHSMGTALKGRQGSSGPQSLEVVQAGPSPEEGRMAPPCEVSPLRLSWQVSLGLSLPSGSGWGKGPLSHWTRHEGRPPHPLQLAGPALTSRALPEPGGAFRGLADGTSVGNLLCNKTTHKVKCRLKPLCLQGSGFYGVACLGEAGTSPLTTRVGSAERVGPQGLRGDSGSHEGAV